VGGSTGTRSGLQDGRNGSVSNSTETARGRTFSLAFSACCAFRRALAAEHAAGNVLAVDLLS